MEGLETKLEAGVEDTTVAAGDTTVEVEETKLEAGVNAHITTENKAVIDSIQTI